MGPTGRPRTSVTNYQSTLRNIPEERSSHLHCGGSLESRIETIAMASFRGTCFLVCMHLKATAQLTFRGPCIVINSHNKSQQDALFLKFIFDKGLYMFRTDQLSIIRSLNTV
jgi:hypothetical protein